MKRFDGFTEVFDCVLTLARALAAVPEAHPELRHLCELIGQWLTAGADELLSRADPRDTEKSRLLLEVQFLLDDFAADPRLLEEWASAEPHRRNQRFGFTKLRERREAREGTPGGMVLAERDHYRTHSIRSHPFPLSDEMPSADDPQLGLLADLGDLVVHAYAALQSASSALGSVGVDVAAVAAQVDVVRIEEGLDWIERVATSHIPPDERDAMRVAVPKKRSARRFWDE